MHMNAAFSLKNAVRLVTTQKTHISSMRAPARQLDVGLLVMAKLLQEQAARQQNRPTSPVVQA